MATYKVIQDIEAEDKFIGALTLKQFIFACITFVLIWVSFMLMSGNMGFVAIPLVPFMFFFGFLAFPWGRDQPTETWLLAKLHYYFKPRRRIWDQTGIQELVKITAPPKIERFTSDNLSQTEVKSRLKALADTIDTRGWAIKHVGEQSIIDDRLITPESILPKTESINSSGLVDIFDDKNTTQIDSKIKKSSTSIRGAVIEKIKDITANPGAAKQTGNWFMGSTDNLPSPQTNSPMQNQVRASMDSTPITAPNVPHVHTSLYEENLARNELQTHVVPDAYFQNHKAVMPISSSDQTSPINVESSVTDTLNPATIRLAGNNDRTVSSIQREVSDDSSEVIVPLH